MGTAYDEDLVDNAFFQALQKDYTEVFEKAILEGCVICVPRAGSLPTYTITLDDIFGHILVPSYEMPESHFNALNGRDVKISNSVLTMEYDLGCHFSTHILFEETYYTEDMLKYRVLCIEHPLEPKVDGNTVGLYDIRTLRDCIDMLWLESGKKKVVEQLDRTIEDFLNNSQSLEGASVQTLKDLTSALYAKCLQVVFKDIRLREKATANMYMLKNLKLSVETYLHHGIYGKLFKHISECTSYEDSKLNKIIRNSADIQLNDLEIKEDLHSSIPKARFELGKIDGYSTVLGKLGCVRKMLGTIASDPSSASLLAADDLLPTIIYVVIKTSVSNWIAQITFLKQFHFSSTSNNDRNEEEYLITTLEAAIEHIKSGVFLGPSAPEGQTSVISEYSSTEDMTEEPTSMTALFRHVARGDLEEVREILEKDKNIVEFTALNLCHPLCVCDSCHKVVSRCNRSINPTVNTYDDAGMTVLHIAAMYGQPSVVEYLLSVKADHGATDLNGHTPLHHSALRGHQTSLLILAQSGADVNAADNSLNTPLHFSCLNGHEGCVKALIYYCEHAGQKFCINAQNIHGDTPLHNAAKWGYLSIVRLLLDNHADAYIFNRRKQSPFDVSSNPKVMELLFTRKPKTTNNSTKKTYFDFLDESPEKRLVPGDKQTCTEQIKRVDKMLKAIACGDINLACFYLGLSPKTISTTKDCHPLASALNPKLPTPSSVALTINACNSEGYTAIHMSAIHGCVQLTQLLVANGVLLDVQTRSSLTTPLMFACQNQWIQIATALLDAGCDPNMQDIKGNSALHYAAGLGNTRLVELLLQNNADVCIRNRAGRTACEEAEDKMALGIIKLLKERSTA